MLGKLLDWLHRKRVIRECLACAAELKYEVARERHLHVRETSYMKLCITEAHNLLDYAETLKRKKWWEL